jgi:UDP-glucose 4-epimerase
MRAVVTGGAGFIGSHLVDGLLQAGADVLIVDDLSTGTEANLADALAQDALLAQIDVRDAASTARVIGAFRPHIVFHLAAQIDVRVSMGRPSWDASTNVVGTVNVLAAAAAAGVRRVINTSTGGAIYGECSTFPTPETQIPSPISAYGLSKRTAEKYCDWFRSAHRLDCLTLRYSNVYGPRQNPSGEAGVVTRFCDVVLRGGTPVVFGDGRQTRDYVFVGDVVAANLAAATAVAHAHDHYNIGTGIEVSVLDLLATIHRCAAPNGATAYPEFRAARDGEIIRSCLDVQRAHHDLGLDAPTSLAEGITRTLAWLRSRHAAPLHR